MREIALRDSLDILLIRSEQKQQSLGTGKFSAGASCLITNNPERRKQFDSEASKTRTMDQRLATFYREQVSEAVISLVQAQVKSAEKYVKDHPSRRLVANGPVVLENRLPGQQYLNEPEGYSFGFFVPSFTEYTAAKRRIDPGLGEEDERPCGDPHT